MPTLGAGVVVEDTEEFDAFKVEDTGDVVNANESDGDGDPEESGGDDLTTLLPAMLMLMATLTTGMKMSVM